ncbi:hypothetical protein HanIR_Chr12g0597301 [Helianthus annuus]|nr:hypothetical protein HanIR_Chr12g0597301 [Helianthus annuus]
MLFENTEVFLPFRVIDRTVCSIGRLNRSVRNFRSSPQQDVTRSNSMLDRVALHTTNEL